MKLTFSSRVLPAVAILVAALAVAGCGSTKKSSSTPSAAPATSSSTPSTTAKPSSGSSGGGSTVKVSADPSGALKFDKSSLTAKAGKVTIAMTNPSSVTHGIGVNGNGVDKDGPTVGMGSTSTVTVTLKPGKYTFYCPVPGHKAGGMKGTLTVK
jgi:plastocyanin